MCNWKYDSVNAINIEAFSCQSETASQRGPLIYSFNYAALVAISCLDSKCNVDTMHRANCVNHIVRWMQYARAPSLVRNSTIRFTLIPRLLQILIIFERYCTGSINLHSRAFYMQ